MDRHKYRRYGTVLSAPTYYAGGKLQNANLAIDPESGQPGILLSRGFDNRGRIAWETDTNSQLQSIYSYSLQGGYDGAGNVTGYNDSVMGKWSVGYDSLHRLSQGAITAGAYAGDVFNETYDHFGNRNQQTVYHEGTQVEATPYLNFSSNNNRVDGWSYDAAGNLLYDGVNQSL